MSGARSRDTELSHVAVEILVSLLEGERHGYAIKLDVEERIGSGFLLGSGTLYQSRQRLERRGYFAEVDEPEPADGRRVASIGSRRWAARRSRVR